MSSEDNKLPSSMLFCLLFCILVIFDALLLKSFWILLMSVCIDVIDVLWLSNCDWTIEFMSLWFPSSFCNVVKLSWIVWTVDCKDRIFGISISFKPVNDSILDVIISNWCWIDWEISIPTKVSNSKFWTFPEPIVWQFNLFDEFIVSFLLLIWFCKFVKLLWMDVIEFDDDDISIPCWVIDDEWLDNVEFTDVNWPFNELIEDDWPVNVPFIVANDDVWLDNVASAVSKRPSNDATTSCAKFKLWILIISCCIVAISFVCDDTLLLISVSVLLIVFISFVFVSIELLIFENELFIVSISFNELLNEFIKVVLSFNVVWISVNVSLIVEILVECAIIVSVLLSVWFPNDATLSTNVSIDVWWLLKSVEWLVKLLLIDVKLNCKVLISLICKELLGTLIAVVIFNLSMVNVSLFLVIKSVLVFISAICWILLSSNAFDCVVLSVNIIRAFPDNIKSPDITEPVVCTKFDVSVLLFTSIWTTFDAPNELVKSIGLKMIEFDGANPIVLGLFDIDIAILFI